MVPGVTLPPLGGKGDLFGWNVAQKMEIWSRVANLDVSISRWAQRRSMFVWPLAVINQALRDYLDPDALDSASQGAARFLHLTRSAQPADEFLARFDVSQRKAEARMHTGGAFPENALGCLRVAAAARRTRRLCSTTRLRLAQREIRFDKM